MLKLLLLFAVAIVSFGASYHFGTADADSRNGPSITVLSDMFTLHNLYKETINGHIYLVKKNGGTDDGKLYIMKVQHATEASILESETLIAARDSPWVTKVQYAFIQGHKLFIIMDFGSGGSVDSRLRFKTFLRPVNKPNATIAKLITSELVAAILSMHSFNVLHLDTQRANIVIDSDGHIKLTDFGYAEKWNRDNLSITKREWRITIKFLIWIFPKPIVEEDQLSLLNLLNNMTDAQIPELKNHTYFTDVDWDKMVKRECEPPFEPTETQIRLEEPKDLKTLFTDDEINPTIFAKFGSYVYVAPEHRNSS